MGLLDTALPKKTENTTMNAQQIEVLRGILVWHLRTHTVPAVIRKGYSTIELTRVKSMLGASKFSAADFAKLLNTNQLLESNKPDGKGFVTVKRQNSQITFSLTPERVQNLTKVVQFLEKQKHDINAAVEEQKKLDLEEEKQRELENQAKI